MRKVSVRLDDARAKKLDQIYDFYGFTSATESDNLKAMVDMLHDLTQNRINSQAVSNKLAEHQDGKIDTDCALRIKASQLIKVLKGEGTAYKYQDVFYCVQWEKGKVKRQLKLVTPLVCEICSLLKEKAAQEPDIIIEPEEIEQPAPMITIPQSTTASTKPNPQDVPNSFNCDKKGCRVHYAVCFECREKQFLTYRACILANPQIAIALAFWKKSSGLSK